MTETTLLPLTSRARISLAIARGVAASVGHDNLTPVHIALGLLREGENPAVAALHSSGVALRTLRRELEAQLDPRGRTQPHQVAIQETPGEGQVVARAIAESTHRNGEFVGPHHLLLALLRDPNAPIAQLFARHGVSYESAVTSLQSVLRGP